MKSGVGFPDGLIVKKKKKKSNLKKKSWLFMFSGLNINNMGCGSHAFCKFKVTQRKYLGSAAVVCQIVKEGMGTGALYITCISDIQRIRGCTIINIPYLLYAPVVCKNC